jgi:hypothetical protein
MRRNDNLARRLWVERVDEVVELRFADGRVPFERRLERVSCQRADRGTSFCI